MKIWMAAVFTLASAAANAQSSACTTGGGKTVDFDKDIQPLLDSHCLVCHQNAGPVAGLSLQAGKVLGNTINVPSTQSPLALIAPGDPENSYLFHKVVGDQANVGGEGDRMPLTGEYLSADEIDLLKTWITECD